MSEIDATVMQDLRYTYDPAGNITRIEDAALKTVNHANQRVVRNRPLNGTFNYPDNAGNGVTAYIIDTGILTTHSQFEGRASLGPSLD